MTGRIGMRRSLAIGSAALLAAAGSFLLIAYVNGAEERALEGHRMMSVLIVRDPIERGATLADVRGRVELRSLEAGSVADAAISNLDDLTGMVAAVDLVPGEQLLRSRFETPGDFAAATQVAVPAELIQATLSLAPERAVGGRLTPGDLVAVVASFTLLDSGSETSAVATSVSTRIILHDVLVTRVQVEQLPRGTSETAQDVLELAPSGNLLITLAVTAEELQRVVFTAEYGSLWLALEQIDTPEPRTPITDRSNIFSGG